MKFYRLLLLMIALAFGILAAEAQIIPTTGYQVQAAAKRAFNQSTIFNDATNIAHLKLPFITSSKLGTDAMGNVIAVSDSSSCGGCTDCACLKTLVITYDSIRLRTLYSNPDTVLHLTNTVANIVSVTMKSDHYGDTYDNMGELLAISDINVFKILSTEYSTLLNAGGYGVMGQKETGGTYSDSPKGIVIANNDADATSGRSKLTVTIYYNEQDTLGNPVNCGGYQPVCSGCACIQDTVIWLRDTIALQNASGTPITLLPAAGAGKSVNVHSMYIQTFYGNTDYNNNSLGTANEFLVYYNSLVDGYIVGVQMSQSADSPLVTSQVSAIGTGARVMNTPLLWGAKSATSTGDATFMLHIYYTIEDSLGNVVQNGGNCGVTTAYVDSLFEAAKLYACDSCSGSGSIDTTNFGHIVETGGRYSTFYNTEDNLIAGVFRGVGSVKQVGANLDGFFNVDLSPLTSNAYDTSCLAFGRFAGTNIYGLFVAQNSSGDIAVTLNSQEAINLNSGEAVNITATGSINMTGDLVLNSVPASAIPLTSSDSLLVIAADGSISKVYHADISGGSSCACIRDTVIYITDTLALQNAFSSPITLISAPGSGKFLNVHNAYLSTYFGNTNYNNNTGGFGSGFYFFIGNSGGTSLSSFNINAGQTNETLVWGAAGTDGINQPLTISGQTDVSTGDTTFKLHIYYTIEDFN